MAEENLPRIPPHFPDPHRDEPGEVAKRVAALEALYEEHGSTLGEAVELELQRLDLRLTKLEQHFETGSMVALPATDPLADPPGRSHDPNPFALPPKMLRGRDKGGRR